MNHPQQLEIISQAWGKQDGYCFFPWIDGDCEDKDARKQAYHEGPAFQWPDDKAKILEHMAAHTQDDMYWCPSLFEQPRRRMDQAMDEHCLWADLDEVDPRDVPEEYMPTVAWETSPGRYQGLWLIMRGFDVQGASWPGGENQRLTAFIEADPSGWDTTQLLRIPGWVNHKPEYRDDKGNGPQGSLLWWRKDRRYLPDHFADLPEIDSASVQVRDVLEEEVGRVDRHAVWDRVRLKVNKAVRDFMTAKESSGDRSDVLWQIERELADAGCTVLEIVALVKVTPWNKYEGRADEFKRLTAEAAKAVDARPEEVQESLEAEANRPAPQRLGLLLQNIPKPVWIIEGIWTRGSCGFIAGQPKSFKSWMALDMALSVSTGMHFLGHFAVREPGPVLYVQEEDPAATLKQRIDKIWPGKQTDRVKIIDGEVVWEPGEVAMASLENAAIDGYIREGLTISDPSWQGWLDEQMAEGEYHMVVLDPLMMMAGDVEENRAQEMTTKIFKPLKQLAEKHNCAIALVHHMRKTGKENENTRGGQLMLGSVANHAWAEDSLYVRNIRGEVHVERESKHTSSGSFKVVNLRNKVWLPVVTDERGDLDEHEEAPEVRTAARPNATRSSAGPRTAKAVEALQAMGRGKHSTGSIARAADISRDGARRQLTRSEKVEAAGDGYWRMKS